MTLGAFFKDGSAIEGMPMRIAVTLILFSIILGLSAKAFYNFTYDNKEKKLMGEINLIEKKAAAMYIQGGARDFNNPDDFSGSMGNIRVNIPDNVVFVVFGGMPSPDKKPLERDLRTDNVFYYVLDNGRVQAGSSIARYSSNSSDLNSPFVLYPGKYELTLELVKNKNGTYVKIE